MANHNTGPLRQILLDLATTPNGINCSKVPGYSADSAQRAVQRLCTEGVLHRAVLGHKSVRYFDTAQHASDYLAKHGPDSGRLREEAKKTAGKRWGNAEAIITAQTKITIASTPPQRFALTDPIIGGFAGLRLGQYAFAPESCAARACA